MSESSKKSPSPFLSSKGASLIEIGILIGLVAIIAIISIDALGQKTNTQFGNLVSFLSDEVSETEAPSGPPPLSAEAQTPYAEVSLPTEITDQTNKGSFSSCNAAFEQGNTTTGVYQLIDRKWTYNAHCLMVTDPESPMQGGWTTIVWTSPEKPTGWSTNVEFDRNPATFLDTGYNAHDLKTPSHTNIAFGRGTSSLNLEIVDLINYDFRDLVRNLRGSTGITHFSTTVSSIKVPGQTVDITTDFTTLTFSPSYSVNQTNPYWSLNVAKQASVDFYEGFFKHQSSAEVEAGTTWAVWVR